MAETVEKARTDVEQSSELANTAHLKMDETARSLLANIGDIATRFENQGRMLEDATALIDSAQRNFSQTLEDREGALADLAAGLSARTSEIEQSMAAFGNMLTKTMDEMTQRSRLVGSTVSSEVGTAIEETTRRFSAATEAMRQAAQQIQGELEETRNQMRRGVMELPEETRQSADAMRKVVADQIAALRDLSEIVTKSGKALDTAPAQAAPARQFASAGAKRPIAAPRPQPVPPFQPAASRDFPPQTHIPSAQQAYPADDQPRSVRPFPPETAQQAPAMPAPQYDPAARDEAGGWVSDLLRRASEEERRGPASPYAPGSARQPQQSELHRIESLNALSMDIARLIDDEASVDLWQRYQRGERNVFTRRLYTLQGQQTFDEIRRKYSSEPEFRRAVDRYVDDFERLLKDVAAKDRDNIMTQTYLTSDTGKVYTMLAHASGRFGN